jgi:hypothetical protein
LVRYVETGRLFDGILFSIPLAMMSLTWGMFHIFWLLVCLGIGLFVIGHTRPFQGQFILFPFHSGSEAKYSSSTLEDEAGYRVRNSLGFHK